MPKIYFVVGTLGTGVTEAASSLKNAYLQNSKVVILRKLGIPERINDSGTAVAAETIDKIGIMLNDDASADATIFMGWRVPEHINEIYLAYPSATFIFTDNNLHDQSRTSGLVNFSTPEELLVIAARQKTSVDSFIATNSLTLSYQRVNQSVFNADYSLNLESTGTIAIAVLGSI